MQRRNFLSLLTMAPLAKLIKPAQATMKSEVDQKVNSKYIKDRPVVSLFRGNSRDLIPDIRSYEAPFVTYSRAEK